VRQWQEFFQVVVVPCAGLGLILYAGVGGPVPPGLYPVLVGLVGYPIARKLDKRQQQQKREGRR
jgi:hypothetical protein